jgi:ABC transporter substrate binding protein (PQQ-dependent alcohol dehydrogenase system)
MTLASAAELAPAMLAAREQRGVQFFLVDAPAAAIGPLAAAAKGRDVLLFNIGAGDDDLRRKVCARELVHTIPSLAMRMDALVQYLVARKWRDLLVLEGPLPADAAKTAALLASAKKFGARIVAQQKFKLGNDPRERDLNNPALLTAVNRDYDTVFVADQGLEFARQLPYRTVRPRPVVGDAGLDPQAWHWTFERYGAPQLNSRFRRRSGGTHMESADWAAWVAVKMVVQARLREPSGAFDKLRAVILDAEGFDGGKGLAVSVRPWDQQLRQAMLLTTSDAVIATAPVPGFLHRTNTLDTVGDDAADTPCRLGG